MKSSVRKRADEIINAKVIESMADPNKAAIFLHYSQLIEMGIKEHYGKIPDWSTLSIQEKVYKGWARCMFMTTESVINGRWHYWLDIRLTQDPKDKPIPQINFLHNYFDSDSLVMDMLKDCLNVPNNGKYSGYRTFELFIDWLLFAWVK